MNTYRLFALILSTVLVTSLSSCGGEDGDNPIEAGGEVPALLASLPDEDYIAVGYADVSRLLGSRIGGELLERFSLFGMMFAAQGVNLKEAVSEVALAVDFEARAYPNFYRALPLIVAVRTSLTPEAIKMILRVDEAVESFELGGVEVLRYEASMPQMPSMSGSGFLAFPEEGLAVATTSRSMLEGYFEVRGDRTKGIGAAKSKPLLDRADKRMPAWLAMRHSDESRDLLSWLAGFDDCVVAVHAADTLRILCVMDFPDAEAAEEAIKYFDFTRREMEKFKEKAKDSETYEKLTADATLNFMLAFTARRSVDLAIYSAEFDSAWFAKLGAPEAPEPEAEPEGEEGER